MRFGLYGGTFDPVHCGHLDVARAALAALALERVSFVPANVPPHRSSPRVPAYHRFAMVALAIAGERRFLLSDLEISVTGPSFTSDTLDRLEARGESLRDWCVITGADAFRDIASWKAYPRLLDRCAFAVVSRPDRPVRELRAALPALADRMLEAGRGSPRTPGGNPGIFLVDAPTAPVSSTDVRRRRAAGENIGGLVPPAVEEYIEKHGLYVPQA